MLEFETDSLFRVGTAGADVIGRGTTNNFFHGSEVGFWKNASEIVSGILQTIPEDNDTEVKISGITNWKVGENTVTISIKDDSGNSKNYKIIVTREEEVTLEENPTSIITSSDVDSNNQSTNNTTVPNSNDDDDNF